MTTSLAPVPGVRSSAAVFAANRVKSGDNDQSGVTNDVSVTDTPSVVASPAETHESIYGRFIASFAHLHWLTDIEVERALKPALEELNRRGVTRRDTVDKIIERHKLTVQSPVLDLAAAVADVIPRENMHNVGGLPHMCNLISRKFGETPTS